MRKIRKIKLLQDWSRKTNYTSLLVENIFAAVLKQHSTSSVDCFVSLGYEMNMPLHLDSLFLTSNKEKQTQFACWRALI